MTGDVKCSSMFHWILEGLAYLGVVPLEGHLPHLNGYRTEKMLLIGPICRYAEDLSIMLKVCFTFSINFVW